MLKIAILVIFLAFLGFSNAQGGNYNAVPTFLMPSNINSHQGSPVSGTNGTEINLWVLPYIATAAITSNATSAQFLAISNDIQIALLYNITEMTLAFTLT